MKTIQYLFLTVILFFPFSMQAEIQQLTVRWDPIVCKDSCTKGLDAAFRKVPGVASVQINQAAGQADIRWAPNVLLKIPAVNAAMSLIGLANLDMRVKVRGTISHDDRDVYLVSLGDNTLFKLMGPIVPKPNTYVVPSIYTHPLSADMRNELLQGEADQRVAIVEGPLFEPERAPPIMMIVERLNFAKPPQP